MVRTLRTSSNSCDVEGIRPTGQFRDSSGWFEGIELAVSGEFDVVRTLRTSSNCDVEGIRPTGQFRDSLGWFERTETP